ADARSYGDLLLEVARPRRRPGLIGATAFAERATQLERRIRLLPRHGSRTSIAARALAMCTGLAAVTVAWVSPRPPAPARVPPAPVAHARATSAPAITPRVTPPSIAPSEAPRAAKPAAPRKSVVVSKPAVDSTARVAVDSAPTQAAQPKLGVP